MAKFTHVWAISKSAHVAHECRVATYTSLIFSSLYMYISGASIACICSQEKYNGSIMSSLDKTCE